MTYLYKNNASGTLSEGITNSATALTLNSGQAALFPNPLAPDTFFATLTDAATETLIEIVSVTSVSGNVMTITRGQDGTSALSWNTGDILSQRVVAAELRQWQGVVPVGGIIMWSGAATAIPENWTLCNGSSGTPNLQNAFVIGAGDTYPVGASGGSANALINHSHLIADPGHAHGYSDPGHHHFLPMTNTSSGTAGTGVPAISTNTLTTANAPVGITISTALTGITTTEPQGIATNSLPPYYALCYIMRVT